MESTERGVPEVNRGIADALADALDDGGDAIVVDVVRGDELEADRVVVLQVRDALQWVDGTGEFAGSAGGADRGDARRACSGCPRGCWCWS